MGAAGIGAFEVEKGATELSLGRASAASFRRHEVSRSDERLVEMDIARRNGLARVTEKARYRGVT